MKLFKNILSYIEGNFNYYRNKIVFLGSPKHLKEQYYYRLFLCKYSCVPFGKCEVCGCPTIKKSWVKKSCNEGSKFPDLMNKGKWEYYKMKHKIDTRLF